MAVNGVQVPLNASQSSSSSTSKCITFDHTWTIDDFVSLCSDEIINYPVLYSGPFVAPPERITTPSAQPVQFELELYPKSRAAGFRNFVSVYVKLNNHLELRAGVWFSIVDAKGVKNYRFGFITKFTSPGSTGSWGTDEMILRAELLNPENGFLHNGKLVVHCKLSIIQCEVPKPTGPTLTEQLADKLYDQTVPVDKWIANLLDSGAHSDVTLVMVDDGGQELRAHKAILATRSRVFADMFESKMAESVTNRVEIVETRVAVFKQALLFIYTGKVGTSLDGLAMDLLVCADKYQLDPLKSICEEYLSACITAECDLSDLFELANLHDAPKLKANVVDSMRKNIDAQLLDENMVVQVDRLLSNLVNQRID